MDWYDVTVFLLPSVAMAPLPLNFPVTFYPQLYLSGAIIIILCHIATNLVINNWQIITKLPNLNLSILFSYLVSMLLIAVVEVSFDKLNVLLWILTNLCKHTTLINQHDSTNAGS